MTDFTVIIPHRDRGKDWRRAANLDTAIKWWNFHGIRPIVVSDGREGDDQFNRSAAYNRGVGLAEFYDNDIIVFSEADLLVPFEQVLAGVELSTQAPGMVVPFSKFMAMTDRDSERVRAGDLYPSLAQADQVRGNRKSIGAVNIVSRETLNAIGGRYDEHFEGAWFDDDAMEIAFRICCGPTRFIDGPGWHQYHLPGAGGGEHLTDADHRATEANRERYERYRQAHTPDDIRALTCE